MTMPGMNGDEVLRKIRGIRADVPVILSSGFTEQEAALQLVREGTALFLAKPYKRPELVAKLREALEKIRAGLS